jgi:uncharacterized membrane protein
MRKYLIAGLLVWMPLGITFLVIRAIVGFLDKSLLLLPEAYQPDTLLGFQLPGQDVVLAVVLVLTTGMIMANLLGRRLVSAWKALLFAGQNLIRQQQANHGSGVGHGRQIIPPCAVGGVSP